MIHDETHSGTPQKKVLYTSDKLSLDLRYLAETTVDGVSEPKIELKILDLENKGHKGRGVYCDLHLEEGQAVTFIVRIPPDGNKTTKLNPTPEKAETMGISLESKWSNS